MKMNVEWIDEEWIEELLWCPSQCYRRARVGDKVYTLYLRWRWHDPWRFKIAEGDIIEGDIKDWRFITDDLFEECGLFFRDKEYKDAEKEAEKIFVAWLKKKMSHTEQTPSA